MIYRRKKEGRTDYRKRLRLLHSGKPRLVIRKSLRYIIAHIVVYEPDGDKTIVFAHSKELKKLGFPAPKRNLPTAYLVGLLIAKKACNSSIKEAIPDLGLHPGIKGTLPMAVLKGARDGGLIIPFHDSILPEQNRIEGRHIAHYAQHNKERFIHYGMNPDELLRIINEVKQKLISDENK